ncbi:MAG: LysM peptidoglycan-binding domain-containing protein [Gammaproteobacteria bacterium]|nr:MAG: LysM peptidoglycan-binding domain-containing protein [Gammaproteobacteria bacterium]
MTGKPRNSSVTTLTVAIILIANVFLHSCSSKPSAPVAERSSQAFYKGKTHSVSRGETLYSVAWRYGLDVKELAVYNGIKSPFTIYPGQKIRIDIRTGNAALARRPSADDAKVTESESPSESGLDRSKNRSNEVKNISKTQIFYSPLKWHWPSAGQPIAFFLGDSGVNKGIDIGGKLGEPVLAAASGRVVYAGGGLSGYGNLLIIKHSEVFLSAYAHNNKLLVKEGDFIKGGQHIADMGSSGTDRVKLHFEIRSEGSPVDPLRYLPKR